MSYAHTDIGCVMGVYVACRRVLTVLVIWAAAELVRQLIQGFAFNQFASHDGHFEKLKVFAPDCPIVLYQRRS